MDLIFLIPISIAIILLFWFAFNSYLYFFPENRRCKKCKNILGDVDKFYYYNPYGGGRYRCANHPLPGYAKKYIEQGYFKMEVHKLTNSQKKNLRIQKSLKVSILDDRDIKISKYFDYIDKTVKTNLEINKKKVQTSDSCGIYKIENLNSSKIYIGQSVDIGKRWDQHKNSNSNSELHIELSHNPNNFDFHIIAKCDKKNLNFLEAYFIKKYDSYKNGYNLTKGNYSHLDKIQKSILNNIEKEKLWK